LPTQVVDRHDWLSRRKPNDYHTGLIKLRGRGLGGEALSAVHRVEQEPDECRRIIEALVGLTVSRHEQIYQSVHGEQQQRRDAQRAVLTG
jgi:hypothetical protein